MKVISLSEDWYLKVTCQGNYYEDGGCDSVFEVNETDLIPRYVRGDLHFVWVCPHCGRLNCIEEKLVPKRIQYNCAYLYHENIHAWEEMLTNAYYMKLENARRIKMINSECEKEHPNKQIIQELEYPEQILKKKRL